MTQRFSYGERAVRVVFGDRALESLPEELQRLEKTRALLLGTPGRAAQLEAVGRSLGIRAAGGFAGAAAHVPGTTVEAALRLARASGPDCLVALGGGSAVGLAKALARETGLPVVAIPTTYSGSEMTAIWGRTDGETKQTGRDPAVAPVLVVYDPVLTVGLDAGVSAASGMNAIAHAVEAFYAPDASEIASRFAAQAIRLLASALPRVVRRPADPDARREALMGAHFAGCALDLTSTGLHHRLCHVLGGTFGLPHALTHAVLLPHVAAFNAPAAAPALAQVASALDAADAAAGLHALNRALGIDQTLRDLGLTEEAVDRAAKVAANGAYPNPRVTTAREVRDLLRAAL